MKRLNLTQFLKNSFLVLACLLLISSCASKKENSKNLDKLSTTEITEKYWKLMEMNGQVIKMSARQEREAYITMRNDSLKFKGFTGCNYFSGKYEKSKSKINFKNFVAGEKLCDNSAEEDLFISLLKSADNFRTKQDTLWLSSKNKMIAKFEAVYF